VSQRSAIDPAAAALLILLCAAPFFVALGAHCLFPEERLRGTNIAGLIAAFAGLTLAVADGLSLPTRYLVNRQPGRAATPRWTAEPARAGAGGLGGRIEGDTPRTAAGSGSAPCRPGPGARETR
jgi:hypothetical protein